MSFIRYRYKSEKDFKVLACDGMGCSVAYLKQFLIGKSSKSTSRRSKDKIDFIIRDASTNEEYQNDSDLIPCCTSVIVIRQLQETFESLTPETVQCQRVSFDNIIDSDLRSGLQSKIPFSAMPCTNTSPKTTTEFKLIADIQKQQHQMIKFTSIVCYECNQRGHIKRHCPRLIRYSKPKLYSSFLNNKNIVSCNVNNITIKESLSNKIQTSNGTNHVVPIPISSTFVSSNWSPEKSSINCLIDFSEDENDTDLNENCQASSSVPLSYKRSRNWPYPLPYNRVHRPPISEARATFS